MNHQYVQFVCHLSGMQTITRILLMVEIQLDAYNLQRDKKQVHASLHWTPIHNEIHATHTFKDRSRFLTRGTVIFIRPQPIFFRPHRIYAQSQVGQTKLKEIYIERKRERKRTIIKGINNSKYIKTPTASTLYIKQ